MLYNFNGVIVLAPNNNKNNPDICFVWRKGGALNDRNFTEHHWPGGYGKNKVRHYPHDALHPDFLTKGSVKKEMGVSNLVSQEIGHKIYKDTKIGDVLYLTYDTNIENMMEVLRVGFIDKPYAVVKDL